MSEQLLRNSNSISSAHVSIDPELAARLTLLHLRTAVPTGLPLRDSVCAVGCCLGRDEWELATFGELAEWERAYPYRGKGGWAEDDIATLLRKERQVSPEAVAAAEARGAVHARRYTSADPDDGITGHIWCTRYDPSGQPPPECARCGVRPAHFAIHWFERTQPARSLCQACIDEELDTYQFDKARDLDRSRAELLRAGRTMGLAELAELAEEQAMWWALRVTPPFVRNFIARYRPQP